MGLQNSIRKVVPVSKMGHLYTMIATYESLLVLGVVRSREFRHLQSCIVKPRRLSGVLLGVLALCSVQLEGNQQPSVPPDVT